MNAISVSHISKSFIIPHEKRDTLREWVASGFKPRKKDVLHAIDDVSFTVGQGESFGIIGRNGSGKSTLLKVLAGIYPVDSGKVVTNGKISPFLELGVGFNYDLSARDNVYLNGTVLGLSKAEIDDQFDEIIRFSELEQFVDQKLKNFSSGMQVRLAFSVAIKANADIYLMDEVLAVGDMAFQQKCFEVFRQFRRDGKILIFVSHDLASVRQFCDRSLYLKGGKAVLVGRTDEVLDRYVYEDQKAGAPVEVSAEQSPVAVPGKRTEQKTPVVVKKVRILDKQLKPAQRIATNDAMGIEIELEAQEPLADIVVGMMLKDSEGKPIFGTNTEILGYDLDLDPGLFTCRFIIEVMPIRQGPIQVTVAVHKRSSTEHFDWKDEAARFDIVAKQKNVGFVQIPVSFSGILN